MLFSQRKPWSSKKEDKFGKCPPKKGDTAQKSGSSAPSGQGASPRSPAALHPRAIPKATALS